MTAEFPEGASVEELMDALADVRTEDRAKQVVVMFLPAGEDEHGLMVPGTVRDFHPFPEMVEDPQPPVVVFVITAHEGDATAAAVEALGAYQRYLDFVEGERLETQRAFDEIVAETIADEDPGDEA